MNLTDRFNHWPPAVRAHDWLTSKADLFTDSLSTRASKVFSPIGDWMMRTYLGLQPHSDIESVLYAGLAVSLFVFAYYLNSLP
jgi:hypothetical protein